MNRNANNTGRSDGAHTSTAAGNPAGMKQCDLRKRSRDATIGGMDQHHQINLAPDGKPRAAMLPGTPMLTGMNSVKTSHHARRRAGHAARGLSNTCSPAGQSPACRDAKLRRMDTCTHQAHAAEPETARERMARVQAAAAVQIAQAAAGQPTKWTVIRDVVRWLMEQAS